MTRWIVRSLEAALALTVLQAVVGGLLFAGEPPQPGALRWALLANTLTALLVTFVAARLQAGGLQRAGLLFVVLFGIPANYLAEAYFFDIGMSRPMLARAYAFQLVTAAAFAAFVAWRMAGAAPSQEARPKRSPASWALRIALGALAYVLAYFTAGLVAYPFVADFYSGRAMPPIGPLAFIQVFRGLAFVGVILVLVRWLGTPRRPSAILAGLTLSVVGGVAPLLVPNPYLPEAVRMVHLVEVGVSNLLFGLFVGWLLGSSADPMPATALGVGVASLPATD